MDRNLHHRKEKYHRRIPQQVNSDNVKSIHESFRSKEENFHEYLLYDTHRRKFGLDHLLTAVPAVDDFRRGIVTGRIIRYHDATITDHVHCGITLTGEIEKRIAIRENDPRTLVLSYAPFDALLGIEFSIGIFNANLRLNTGQKLSDLVFLEGISDFSICGDQLAPIMFSTDQPCTLLGYPIETISSSESGYERIFQGCCLMLVFTTAPTVSISL